MSKYLDRLKSRLAQKRLPEELTKPTKHHFVSFGGAQSTSVPEIEPPPLNAEGVPCASCPRCGQGEFWRWSKVRGPFDPQGWRCWLCAPPAPDSGPWDFCGVPDDAPPEHADRERW
jgi:hypothetical protein